MRSSVKRGRLLRSPLIELQHNTTRVEIEMKLSPELWTLAIALVAYGTGAVVGETKKVRPIVFGASAILAATILILALEFI